MKIFKFTFLVMALLGTSSVATNAFATNLMDVYKQAVISDPKFKAARSQWLADRESLAISKAGLLPQLSITGGSIARNRDEIQRSFGSSTHYHNTVGYTLQLTQPIFNFGNWANVWKSQADVKKAQSTFFSSEEDLLQRTAQAYFNVLLAKDVLSYSRANKSSVERLYVQAKHKYDVGLTPITDLEDARKNYDIAISDEIGSINDLNDKFEQLSEITGIRYNDLDTIAANLPLLSPQPANIEKWTQAAEQQNYELIAARFAAISARENIKIQNAGHLPTINAQGSYQYGYDNFSTVFSGFSRGETISVGAQFSVPIFQGGGVSALARQANYQYQTSVANQNQTHRSIVSKTRQAYLGVLSYISKIKADKQAIKSAQSSLRATEASYSVGTRTMADVLTSQTQLYDAQKTFAEDEYNYIIQLLTLKQLTGILDVCDLMQINSWLEKSVATKRRAPRKRLTRKRHSQAKIQCQSEPKTAQTIAVKTNGVANNMSLPAANYTADNTQPVVTKTNGIIDSTQSQFANGTTTTPTTSTTTSTTNNAQPPSTTSVANNTTNNANTDKSKIVVIDVGEVQQAEGSNAATSH